MDANLQGLWCPATHKICVGEDNCAPAVIIKQRYGKPESISECPIVCLLKSLDVLSAVGDAANLLCDNAVQSVKPEEENTSGREKILRKVVIDQEG